MADPISRNENIPYSLKYTCGQSLSHLGQNDFKNYNTNSNFKISVLQSYKFLKSLSVFEDVLNFEGRFQFLNS